MSNWMQVQFDRKSNTLRSSFTYFDQKIDIHTGKSFSQKDLFLQQLTHNMTKDCSMIYQFLNEN